MRILLINAFHYLRGGVERTYLDESRWLTAAGHQVAHLAIRDARNLPAGPWDRFAPAADFGEGAAAIAQLANLPNLFWSVPAGRAAADLVAEFRPEVAHLHAPSRYLSPSVLAPLERSRVPTVMTLHDFKPWCTNRILFAHGAPCERCKGGTHWHALTTGCVQDSRAKSAVGMIEAYVHAAMHAYRHVSLWIAPSRFVQRKAIEFGVEAGRLRVLAHGVEGAPAAPAGPPAAPRYVLYSGRLSVEKGVALLPELARAIAPVPLRVAGDGPLRTMLERAARSATNIHVLGHLEDGVLAEERRGAAAVVVPSLFYEHFCYAAAEALLDERPVIAARIGAIPELVEHQVTGWLATPGDVAALAEGTRRALTGAEGAGWAATGAARVREVARPGKHVAGLLEIYREAMAMRDTETRHGSVA
ncbi:MAG: glycosyltransferase [Candidatus Eiseniibacteriota bacterium]